MKVLVACEFSGIVRDAFLRRGHDAWSCDWLPTEMPGPHYQQDVCDLLNFGWDLLIAHPPCTYLANSGVSHLHSIPSRKGKLPSTHGAARWVALEASAEFFNQLLNAPAQRIAVENPIPHKYARERIGNYSQIIHPWQFGHQEMKATCLWLRNLPLLVPTDIVGPPPKTKEERASWQIKHRASPGPERWKFRSRTYKGIAEAMAEQWGGLK